MPQRPQHTDASRMSMLTTSTTCFQLLDRYFAISERVDESKLLCFDVKCLVYYQKFESMAPAYLFTVSFRLFMLCEFYRRFQWARLSIGSACVYLFKTTISYPTTPIV